jgi:hypothetical protein
MFSWFRKNKEVNAEKNWIDRVYVNAAAKENALIELAKTESDIIFVAWFADTLQHLKLLFAAQNITEERILLAGRIDARVKPSSIVFVEHYPLHAQEKAFLEKCSQNSIIVFSAMDEPLFKYFGSDNMLPLVKLLGMKETEAIEHSYVTQAITRGQEKIAAQVMVDLSATSQAEWMSKHLPPRKA